MTETVEGTERARGLRKVGAMLGAMKGSFVDPVAVWVLDGAIKALDDKAKEAESGKELHPTVEEMPEPEPDDDDTHSIRSASHRTAPKRGHR